MTRLQASIFLEDLKRITKPQYIEALEMAIEALAEDEREYERRLDDLEED